jgi:hypothetical protein
MTFRAFCAGAALIALTGCASVFGGFSETVSVKATSDGADIAGAQCALSNSRGTWHVTTPALVTVHTSFDDLDIQCTYAAYVSNVGHVPASRRALVHGNVLLPGSLIATAVDIGSGSAFDYPSPIVVKLHPPRETTAVNSSGD